MNTLTEAQEIIRRFNQEAGWEATDCVLVKNLKEEFTEDQIALILTILQNTCKYCYDWDAETCSCTNDE